MQIKLDIHQFKTRKSAHAYLKKALRFPDYYGENLDALHDCLGDIAEETTVILSKNIGNEHYLGNYGKTMLEVFRASAEENKYLKVLFD